MRRVTAYVRGDCERRMVSYLGQSAGIKKGGETDRQKNEGEREERGGRTKFRFRHTPAPLGKPSLSGQVRFPYIGRINWGVVQGNDRCEPWDEMCDEWGSLYIFHTRIVISIFLECPGFP